MPYPPENTQKSNVNGTGHICTAVHGRSNDDYLSDHFSLNKGLIQAVQIFRKHDNECLSVNPTAINTLTAKLFNLNFHPFEVVSR